MPGGCLPAVNIHVPGGCLPAVNIHVPGGCLPAVNIHEPGGSLPKVRYSCTRWMPTLKEVFMGQMDAYLDRGIHVPSGC